MNEVIEVLPKLTGERSELVAVTEPVRAEPGHHVLAVHAPSRPALRPVRYGGGVRRADGGFALLDPVTVPGEAGPLTAWHLPASAAGGDEVTVFAPLSDLENLPDDPGALFRIHQAAEATAPGVAAIGPAGLSPRMRLSVPLLRLPGEATGRYVATLRACDEAGEAVTIPRFSWSGALGCQYCYVSDENAPRDARGVAVFHRFIDLPPQVARLTAAVQHFDGPAHLALLEPPRLDRWAPLPVRALIGGEGLSDEDAVAISVRNDGASPTSIAVRADAYNALGKARPAAQLGYEGGVRTQTVPRGHSTQTLPVPLNEDARSVLLEVDGPAAVTLTGLEPTRPALPHASLRAHLDGLADSSPSDRYKGVVVLLTTAGGFGAAGLPLRSHHVATALARSGYAVIYLPMATKVTEHEVEPGLFQSSFTALDHVRSRLGEFSHFARRIFLCSTLCNEQAVLTVDVARALGWRVVFEVRDDMEGMKLAGFSAWYSPTLEDRMYQRSDAVFCVSEPLVQRATLRGARPGGVWRVKNGIDEAVLDEAKRIRAATSALRERERHVGYFGHLFEGRFDRRLIEDYALGSRRPIHLIGPGLKQRRALEAMPNVRMDDQITIPSFLRRSTRWKVGLLPFHDNRLTLSLDPIKQYLYLALGMRIVSAPVYELSGLPRTWIYRDAAEFAAAVEAASADRSDEDEVDAFLAEASWQQRAAEQLRLIEGIAE